MLKVNFIEMFEKIPHQTMRYRLMDRFIEFFVPFSRGLRLKIVELSEDRVTIISPETTHRRNHVKGAHACALALLGEYPAGMLLAQKYPPSEYRIIISKLTVEYHKQGRGELTTSSKRPSRWPKVAEGDAWVNMVSEISNDKHELVAICKTKWQVKRWSDVKSR